MSRPPHESAEPGRSRQRARPHSPRLLLLLATVLVALGFSSEGRGEGAPTAGVFQKGFTLGGWWRDDYLNRGLPAQIALLRAAGVEWVALTPRWFQADRRSTRLFPHPEQSPSDESLRTVVGLLQSQGVHVFLKPQVDLLGPGFRGEISFDSEEDWKRWFQSYREFIDHYARLAAELHASLFCVGVELDGTRHRAHDWREVIREVREQYPGPLVYAANFGRDRDIAFWDALDYVGIDAYYPVAGKPDPSLPEVEGRWSDVLRELHGWVQKLKRPVLFTEIGYRSIAGSGIEPWEWKRSAAPSGPEQALLYRGALQALWSEPWIAGVYWWQLLTTPPRDPASDDGYTPQGKPAWSVIREFYARERTAPKP